MMIGRERRKVRVRNTVAALSVFTVVQAAHGFSLLGGCRSFDCFAGGEFFQPFDREFRWSIPDITVAAAASFVDAFGSDGVLAVDRSLGRWAAASEADPAGIPETTWVSAREGGVLYDVESLVMHELGHALGLGHPDKAARGGMNYGPDGSPVPTTGTEVMFSGMPNNTIVREVTRDDVEGIRYLYAEENVNPIDGPGIGTLSFVMLDSDAAWGTGEGANIDLFATTNDEHPGLFRGGALATSAISFVAGDPQNDPGIINGIFEFEPVVAGVDIYINMDRPITLLHPVPEPSWHAILVIGLAAFGKRLSTGRRSGES
jgi:hypothetical protein